MKKIAITTGDPNGIGAEITIKALNKMNLDENKIVLISNEKVLNFYGKLNKNYEELKLSLSEIDAELKQIASSSSNPVLVVSSDTFKYLEKYGFTIYSLEENNNLSDKTIADVKKLLANKQISYIFLKDNEEENNTIKDLKNNYEFKTVSLNTISTLSASDRKDKKDYISIMMDNINSIKLEVND